MSAEKPSGRATNLEEYNALRGKFITTEGYEAGLAFQPRPTDIFVSPFAKSGTTWLQQIVHGLRTRGSMDFSEITDVTPWLEMAYDYGWDVEAEQVANPRVFKSHLAWHTIPKGAKYICSIRNPYEVAVSFYRFINGWWFETDSISLEVFTQERFTNDPDNSGYWYHLASWWEQRQNPDVLLLSYEDMREDLPTAVRKIADLMDITLDDDLLDIVVSQSSKEFMLAHKSQFDEHLMQQFFEQRSGVPVSLDTAKVTTGNAATPYRLSPELIQEFDAIWERLIFQRFGMPDYAALRSALKA